MKVLQISTVCGSGSVGRITVDIYHTLEKQGDDCLIAYGRRTAPKGVHAFCFGSPVSMGIHVLSTFFKGEHGFASASATRKLILRSRNGIRTWFSFTTFMDLSCRRNSYLTIWKKRESRWCGPFTTAGLTPGTVRSMIITTVDSGGMDAKTAKSIEILILMHYLKIIRRTIIKEKRRPLPVWRTLPLWRPPDGWRTKWNSLS